MGSWHGHSDSEIMGQGGNPTATQISSQYQQAPFKTIGKILNPASGVMDTAKKAVKSIKGGGAKSGGSGGGGLPGLGDSGNINPEAGAAEDIMI